MPRGFGEVAFRDGSSGGMTGRPTKVDGGAIDEIVLFEFNLRFFDIGLKVLDCKKARMYSLKAP